MLSAPLLITWVVASFAFCQGAMFQTYISWFLDQLSWPVYIYDMFFSRADISWFAVLCIQWFLDGIVIRLQSSIPLQHVVSAHGIVLHTHKAVLFRDDLQQSVGVQMKGICNSMRVWWHSAALISTFHWNSIVTYMDSSQAMLSLALFLCLSYLVHLLAWGTAGQFQMLFLLLLEWQTMAMTSC